MIAEHQDALVEFLPIRHEHATLAGGQRLGAVKAEHAGVAQAAGLATERDV